MGRAARGVRGMALEPAQSVIAMLVAEDESQSVLTATENGYGKRTSIVEYTRHGRGTKGMIAIQQSERNGKVVAATLVRPDDEIMLITDSGVLRAHPRRRDPRTRPRHPGRDADRARRRRQADRAAADRRERCQRRRGDRRRPATDTRAERRRRAHDARRLTAATLDRAARRSASLGMARGATAPDAATPSTPAKKELVQRLLRLQQSDDRGLRAHTSSSARRRQMMREAGLALAAAAGAARKSARQLRQSRSRPRSRSTSTRRSRSFASAPLKLAPSTIGAGARSEDDRGRAEAADRLARIADRQESTSSSASSCATTSCQKLVAEMPPRLDPKLHGARRRIRAILGVPPAGASRRTARRRRRARPASK